MKFNKWLVLGAILCLGFLPSGRPFPNMQLKTLDGKVKTFPNDLKGKFALIGMAYSIKAQEDLYTWIDPAGSLAANPLIPVNLYFIPMTGEIKNLSQEKIMNKIKSNLDKSLHPHVLIYQEDPSPYIKSLDMKDKNIPYFFVVDPNGKITYVTSGRYTEAKMDMITDKLAE